MIRYKNTSFTYLLMFIGFVVFISTIKAQEIKTFTSKDFDLQGDVKSCIVVTSYGKEEFTFNKDGQLTKLVTHHSTTDYEKTYYKYLKGELVEKRLENYIGNTLDKNTSIANIYTIKIDTTLQKKITEQIISYNKDFIDQYEYAYDVEGKLIYIKRNNDKGVEETLIDYTVYGGEYTTTHFLNSVIKKSIRTSKKENQKTILTKSFIGGKPTKALEEVKDLRGNTIIEKQYIYTIDKAEFTPIQEVYYDYNAKGVITEEKINKEGEETRIKTYIYQYDNGDTGNWVKKIITPDNTYITRKIEYYEPILSLEEKP